MPSLIKRVQGAFKGFRFPGYGGGFGGYNGFGWPDLFTRSPGSELDWGKEAGLLHQNSAVAACLTFMCNAFADARFVVEKQTSEGEWEAIEGHGLVDLLERPNPFYAASDLWSGTILSRKTSGNGYWRLVPSGLGVPLELHYIPHGFIGPRWPYDGSKFISAYAYQTNTGEPELIPAWQVIHFREGMDPVNIRSGLNPLSAVLREICALNFVNGSTASLAKNGPIGAIFGSPKDASIFLSEEQRAQLKAQAGQKITGDQRGSIFWPSIPMDFTEVGLKPSEMAVAEVKKVCATSICAVLGLDPMVVGLDSDSQTYANLGKAIMHAYNSVMVPLWRTTADALTLQLLPLFPGSDGLRVSVDLSKVAALQEDRNEKMKRLVLATAGPVLTPNEGRAEDGKDAVTGGDELRKPIVKPDPTDSTDPKKP